MITLLTFSSLGQSTDINKLLDKPETRNELFQTILNNNELITDFIKVMKENDHAMMMLENKNQTRTKEGKMEMNDRHQMMDHEKMMSMMKDNPEMMQAMMGNMMDMCEKDTAMQSKMAGIMAQHPEMMKMCRQKMQDEGMMGKDGNMQMMNSESSSKGEGHSHHH
jgi:hypothetical protein